jgi:hypothetical protein
MLSLLALGGSSPVEADESASTPAELRAWLKRRGRVVGGTKQGVLTRAEEFPQDLRARRCYAVEVRLAAGTTWARRDRWSFG